MNRYFCIAAFLLVTLGVLCGCTQTNLPQPTFPLEKNMVTNALEEVGLKWKVTDEQTWYEGHTNYTLYDENEQMIANVSSEGVDGRRSLIVEFIQPPTEEYPHKFSSVPEKDWEKVFNFSTILYGGFREANQVFKKFSNTIINKDIEGKELPVWEKKFSNITCFAERMQVKSNASTEKYLVSLAFYNAEGLAHREEMLQKSEELKGTIEP